METFNEIVSKVKQEYNKSLTTKVLLVDALIVFAFATGIIQVRHAMIL
jgi:DAD family